MPIVLLNGPPQSGKTTIAKELVRREFVNLPLHKPFYEFVRGNLGLRRSDMDQYKDKIRPGFDAPIREALIGAADAVEKVDPVVWVRRVFQSDAYVQTGQSNFVLDSLGKQAQYDWIAKRSLPHLVVNVYREGQDVAYAPYNFNKLGSGVFPDGRERIHAPRKTLWTHNDGDLDKLTGQRVDEILERLPKRG